MNRQIEAVLAELRASLKELYGERLVQMVLFGSQARADAESGSDIDILVVLHGQVSPAEEIAGTGEIRAALSLKYDTVLSCTFVSADRYAAEQSPLLINVRREGVPL